MALLVFTAYISLAACGTDDLSLPADTGEIDFRVLAEDLAEGEPYSADIVSSEGSLDTVSTNADLDNSTIDFNQDVVLIFNLPESSSCPYKPIAGLRYDSTTNIVYPLVPTEGGETCTGDAGQHRVVVAVDRADLPREDFNLWIGSPAGPPQGFSVPVVDTETWTTIPG